MLPKIQFTYNTYRWKQTFAFFRAPNSLPIWTHISPLIKPEFNLHLLKQFRFASLTSATPVATIKRDVHDNCTTQHNTTAIQRACVPRLTLYVVVPLKSAELTWVSHSWWPLNFDINLYSVVHLKSYNVSKENSASFFRVEQYAKQQTRMKRVASRIIGLQRARLHLQICTYQTTRRWISKNLSITENSGRTSTNAKKGIRKHY
jgi:hypothetical protein